MSKNTVSFAVETADGATHTVSLAQDSTDPSTIRGTFDGGAHDLTECAASPDGSWVIGSIQVVFFEDKITIAVKETEAVVDVQGYSTPITGKITTEASSAVTAFVLACKLPAP